MFLVRLLIRIIIITFAYINNTRFKKLVNNIIFPMNYIIVQVLDQTILIFFDKLLNFCCEILACILMMG